MAFDVLRSLYRALGSRLRGVAIVDGQVDWSIIGIYKVERLQGSDESQRTTVYNRSMYRRAEIPDDVVMGMSIAELAVQQNFSKDTAYVSVSSGQCLFLAAIKRRRLNPWPFLRWIDVIKNILEHISWRREWAARDRIAFIRQFTPAGIRYFIEDGCEEWKDPFDRRPDQGYSALHRSWLTAHEPGGAFVEEDQQNRGSQEEALQMLNRSAEQEWRVI